MFDASDMGQWLTAETVKNGHAGATKEEAIGLLHPDHYYRGTICWKNGSRVVGYVVERVANVQAFAIYS